MLFPTVVIDVGDVYQEGGMKRRREEIERVNIPLSSAFLLLSI